MSGRGGTRVGAGRPKGRASPQVLEQKAILEEATRSHGLAALKKLVEILEDGEDERATVQAAKIIMDRGFGSAIQRIEEGVPGDFSDWTDDELRERAEEIARRVIAASRGAKAAKGGGKPRGEPD